MNSFKITALILILSLSGLPVMGEEKAEDNQTQGAFWGALIGAVVGAFIGDENEDQARNAAIGAAIGAGAGLLLGKTLDQPQKAQAAESESARADRIIREMRATNQQLREDLSGYQQKIERLEQAKSQGNVNYRDLQKQKQILQQRQASAEQALSQLTNELKLSQQFYRNSQRENKSNELLQWQIRIAQLEQEKYELESSIDDLMAMKSRL